MNSFHQTLSFHTFEAAVNGVARLARTQGFRIHQRKGSNKNHSELQGIASFGCTAPGCGWFISLKRVPLGGTSTSTAPAEQWLVYTLFDHHKSTCKPARSRRRQASLSSITSLETENTEDELPPELLRPYERSPSLPILMHAKGSKPSIPETAIEAFTSGDYANEEVDYAIREQISRASEVPDPIQLSKSILDLLASIESSGVQQNPSTTSIDPQALLASLSEPLVVPADFTFPNSEVQSLSSQPLNSEAFESSQPFAYAHLAEQQGPANSTKTFATEYDSLPERLHRAASILQTQTIDPQTINPAYTISPSRINGFQPPAPAQSIFSTQPISTFAPEASTSHSDVHNAPPITNGWRDWSDGSEDDSDGNGHDLSQNFLEQEYNNEAQLLANDDSTWESHIEPEDRQDHISDGAESAGEAGQVVVDDEVNDSSSSDSDIPAEQLLKTTTSNRSYTPVQPLEDHGTWSTNLPVQQENYQPLDNYSPPIDRSPSPVPASARRLAPRKSRASYHQVPQPEPEEFFDIYNIFPSFEDAEAAIAANARKSGVPLKIRYRPNSLGDSINARKQACLECLCLCGYRIYLKDDHRGQWRVTNMEGGHKNTCYQGPARGNVRRGTNPFRTNKAKGRDKDSMQVSVPVWESPGTKRKRREDSYSSDRSSSPSILVVTHSDAVMKSVKTVGPGYTPPRDYWHPSLASPSPSPVKRSKKKGKQKATGRGRGRPSKTGGSPDKPIELEDSEDNDLDHDMENYDLPPPLNNYVHPDAAAALNGSPQPDQYARKKLPTTQQLIHGSGRPDILPRHKIPTKTSGPFSAANRSKRRKAGEGSGSSMARVRNKLQLSSVPGESSANDDDGDEDMYYQTGRLSHRLMSQSSRARRSARRSQVSHPEPYMNGHARGRRATPDSDSRLNRSRNRLPSSSGRKNRPIRAMPNGKHTKGINPSITQKMTLSQAGFTEKQLRYLSKGGYTSVKELAREGLACTKEEFEQFSGWLSEDLVTVSISGDHSHLLRHVVRQRVKAIVEEVRVRSTIVWEAAGMMEEGSDADDGVESGPAANGHAAEAEQRLQGDPEFGRRYQNGTHHVNGHNLDERSLTKSAQHHSALHPRRSASHDYNSYFARDDTESSDLEFLGVQDQTER